MCFQVEIVLYSPIPEVYHDSVRASVINLVVVHELHEKSA